MIPDDMLYTIYQMGVKANIYLTFLQIAAWIGFALSMFVGIICAIRLYNYFKPKRKHLNAKH